MLELSQWAASMLDYPLGWMLDLPRDAAILIIALLSSALMTFIRKRSTDQDLMLRCRNDLNRLAELKREAKKEKARAAVQRMQATEGMIKWTQTKAEFLGMAIAIVPLGLLATWAYERLEFVPPKTNEVISLKVYYPLSSVDQLTHIVAPAGIDLEDQAIQVVKLDDDKTSGIAVWKLHARNAGDAKVVIRHRGESLSHQLRFGERSYAPAVTTHEGSILAAETAMVQPKFLGFVPGIALLGFAPWLVGYILLTVPLVPAMRWAFKVY